MIDKRKLHNDLVEMFIWLQWGLENPYHNDKLETVIAHYHNDWFFNRKVNDLVCSVMRKVENNIIE